MVYSKALRCTFFEERKTRAAQNSCNFRVKARWSKNRAAQGFHYINSFISNFFGPNSKTCTCKVRAAWGRVSRGLTVVYCIIIAQNFATMAVRISVICIRFVSTFCVINHDNMMHRFLWYSCTFGIVLQKCNSSTMGPKFFKLISL